MSLETRVALLLVAVLAASSDAAAQRGKPGAVAVPPAGLDPARLTGIDEVVQRAIAARQMPGAVVVVGRGDTVVYEKAFGQRAVAPLAEPMTLDTIFDLASLTKVVATTSAVMHLVEQGTLRLTDPVASWVPDFERYPEYGRDLQLTFGEVGLAGHWVKILLHHLSLYKARLRPGWRFIPE